MNLPSSMVAGARGGGSLSFLGVQPRPPPNAYTLKIYRGNAE
jgi:hypothetical protein